MSKVCNIESEKIVDGERLFYSSNSLTEWNSPLTSLQNGRQMFRNCANLYRFKTDNAYYCSLPALTCGYFMFADTSCWFGDGGEQSVNIVKIPNCENALSMFIHYNKSENNHGNFLRVQTQNLTNGCYMFYQSSPDSIYLQLSSLSSNFTDLSHAFEGTNLSCGVEIYYIQKASNCSEMFRNSTFGVIRLEGSDYNGNSYITRDCSLMFDSVTITNSVSFKNLDGSYSYTISLSQGQGFFTNLLNLLTPSDCTNMFSNFTIDVTNTGGYSYYNQKDKTRIYISEGARALEYTKTAALTSAVSMFENTKVADVYINNSLFSGNSSDGLNCNNMFYNSISTEIDTQYDNVASSVARYYVWLGSDSFSYCSSASQMFAASNILKKVTLSGRNTLCGDKTYKAFGQRPNGNGMFKECISLQTFETRSDDDSKIQVGYHGVSSGIDCFKGCVLRGADTLRCVYHFIADCPQTTIGISRSWADSIEGNDAMTSIFGVCYPTESVTHHTYMKIHFEYND